jgi:hypothetical protein
MRKPNKNTAYKCAREAHEFYKTMNHYHKRAMLWNLLEETGFVVRGEEYMVGLKHEDILTDEDAWNTDKPFEIHLTTHGQELICYKGQFKDRPKLGLVGKRIVGRPRKVNA